MSEFDFSDVAQALGFVVSSAISSLPFGAILQSVVCKAFQLSQHLDDLAEGDTIARNINLRCKMISGILVEHAEDMSGSAFILQELFSCLESNNVLYLDICDS